MDIKRFHEIKPKGKFIKRMYVAVMLWIVGRAIQAAAKIDREVRDEFSSLRNDFIVRLWVAPSGPAMIIGKNDKGVVKYLGSDIKDKRITLDMKIKSLESAILIFTFQESTSQAYCNDRFIVSGDIPDALTIVRILNLIEIFLLPKIIASLAVKRYPKWSQMNPVRKYISRILIYVRTFTF